MGGYAVTTVDPGNRDASTVESELREAIREAPDGIVSGDEREDPDVWTSDGSVHWYQYNDLDDVEAVDPPTDRVLMVNYNDTTCTATGWLYERVDGRFRQTDSYSDDHYGELLLDYFQFRHGISGWLK